jgi:hypothetical protein
VKNSLSENTEESTCQYTGKRSAGDIHQLKITDRKMYQDMVNKLEKCAHLLDREKRELSGHRKKGTGEGHSLARDRRGQVRTELKKRVGQQGALTCWRGQMFRLVKTWQESEPAKDNTHLLVEVGNSQSTEGKLVSKGGLTG